MFWSIRTLVLFIFYLSPIHSNTCSVLTGSLPSVCVGALIYITIRTISHYRNLFARLVFRSGLSSDLLDLSKSLNCFLSFCFKTFM